MNPRLWSLAAVNVIGVVMAIFAPLTTPERLVVWIAVGVATAATAYEITTAILSDRSFKRPPKGAR